MARIFLSHSSVDEREAIALRQWLTDQGWDDVFLDIDPNRGLAAGERWQEALKRAADRCEAVLFVVSPAWAQSKWCLAEFLLAKSLNKRIFGVVLKPVPLGDLPTEMTSEWQLCHLVGEGATERVAFTHRDQATEMAFLADGLGRLRLGLENAGLRADFFPWPPRDQPDRSPYRGLEPLDAADAAVFFGRDVEIMQALDALRGMRASNAESLFVILGGSGAGKSSFLRAGLLPRLARDARHFFPLRPVRPERSPLHGERGLAAAIADANARLELRPVTPGEVKIALAEGGEGVTALLLSIARAARARLIGLPDDAPPPTLVLPVDQAEEMFNVDRGSGAQAGAETDAFLQLIGAALRAPDGSDSVRHTPLIVAFTIRSDRYQPLQIAPALQGIRSVVFDALKPMPRTQFKEVITGPARRASASGKPLDIHADLVGRLLDDCQRGADTLPVLGLTLARLYRDYGSDGDLTLAEYEAMGGMEHVIRNEAESVLSTDPTTRATQLERLRDAFIPALVTIDPQSNEALRRVAAMSELPGDSHPLVQALIDGHLLLSDLREGELVVEVAHESLFRQWDVLADWLREEAADLKEIDRVEQAVIAWKSSGEKSAWLMEGERLTIAETLAAKARYRQRLGDAEAFLRASRERETRRRDDEQRQRKKQINRLRATVVAVGVALMAAVVGVFYTNAAEERTAAALASREAALRQAIGLRLAIEASAMLGGDRIGGDERALLQLVTAGRVVRHLEVEGAQLDALVSRILMEKIVTTGSTIRNVAFSPDGTRIVSGDAANTVRLWDAATGQLIGEPLRGHQDRVSSVAFSPDGTRIVSGSWDRTLKLWDANTGRELGSPLWGHQEWVSSVAFSPDGTRIASGSGDSTLRLWDALTGKPIGPPLDGHHLAEVTSVAFSPDGGRIASGGSDNALRLWDAQSGKPIGSSMRGKEWTVTSVAFSPDGRRIVMASDDPVLRLWDTSTGEEVGPALKGHEKWVSSVAFSPDGARIVSGGADRTLRLWDASSGEPVGKPLRQHENEVTSVAFSPDGKRIISAGTDNTLRLWDATPLPDHGSTIASVAFSPDGTRIVSGSWDGTLKLWDANTGRGLGPPLQGHEEGVSSVAFSSDGTRIASGSDDATLRLWDAITGKPIGPPLDGHRLKVTSVAFSPDGTLIASGSNDATLRLWDAITGKPIGPPLDGHRAEVTSVAFSPDGKLIASGSGDRTLRLWDAHSGKAIGSPLEGHEKWVTSVAFSPDGTLIASGSGDRTLRLWDGNTGQAIGSPLQGHDGVVRSTAFSPDGKRIVSGSDDHSLRLWDAESGRAIGSPLDGHESSVRTVAFSPDGTRIVSGGGDRTLRIWPGPKVLQDRLCDKLTRNMSHREWNEWVSPDIEYACSCPGLPISHDDPQSGARPEMCPLPAS